MKKQIVFSAIIVLLLFSNILYSQSSTRIIYVASWNVENLFDTIDDPEKMDEEFLPNGSKKWNEKRLNRKLKNLSKIIRSMNDMEGPDILGVQEVEHRSLLDLLLKNHFCDKNYSVAYAESPDKRGIDNGLIFNDDLFDLISTEAIEVKLDDGYPTRNILHVTIKAVNNEMIHVFVNHWSSRSGGLENSEPNRIKAAQTLAAALKEIYNYESNPNIIVLGDFNDEPNNKSITNVLNAVEYECSSNYKYKDVNLLNLAFEEFRKGKGTYLFRKNWNMLDQLMISKNLADGSNIMFICNSFEIVQPHFMITDRGDYKGAAIPTYGGRTYLGGYSDHYPVGAKFIFKLVD